MFIRYVIITYQIRVSHNKTIIDVEAQVEMLPQNGYIKLTNEDDIKNMQKMLDMFEDNDDVQNVWHNWEDAE